VNVILLERGEGESDGGVRLTGRRHEHLRDHLRSRVSDVVRVGEVDGILGDGVVERMDRHESLLRITWAPERSLPRPSEVVLAFALPRPPTLRKVLSQATAMGIKRFEIFGSRRVEKSYWDSGAAQPEGLGEALRLGLEQSGDTALPTVGLHRRFRPFVEDVLGVRTPGPVLVADPSAELACPRAVPGALTLVVGPEGGFIPFEIERIEEAGHRLVHIGPRIVRVETAVVAALGRLAE
jgi:RsmE family RNA methyltransferase